MPLDASYDPFSAPDTAAPAVAAPAVAVAPVPTAVPGPGGVLTDPTTGLPAPSNMPDAAGRIGLVPVIDVGNTPPSAAPGEAGSGLRPVHVGETAKPGAAMPAAAVVPQPAAAAPAAAPATPGGAVVPTVAAPPAARAPAQSAADYDPFAGPDVAGAPANAPGAAAAAPGAAVPSQVRGQELRNQPWYQSFKDNLEGALGSVTHGASFGLDEILDPIMPAVVESLTTGKPFSQAYDEAVQFQRLPRKEFEREHPVLGATAELAGSLPGSVMAAPLFGTAAPGASTLAKVGVGARNVAAGAGLGGATGAAMTEGDLGQRIEGAKEGAVIGGGLTAAAPLLPAVGRALYRSATPSAKIPAIVGRTVAETTGGVPVVQPSPVPSVKLNLAQSTGSPAAASALDTLNALNPPAYQAERSAQNKAMLDALTGRAPSEPGMFRGTSNVPEVTAARGSTRATRALQEAGRISRSEEQRLWNTPALTEPNMSTWTTKRALQRDVATMRRNDPDLALAFDESPVLQRIARGLRMFPQKASANQLNRFSSQLRSVARDMNQPGDVRHVATRLANAVHDGMMAAPEVVGQAPATKAEIEAAERIQARQPTPTPPAETTLPGSIGRPKRPVDAITALIDAGGLQDPRGDLLGRDVDAERHRFRGQFLSKIINKKTGLTPNRAREFLRDNGYLTTDEAEDEHIAQNLVEEHIAGNPRYRAGDLADAQYWEALDRANATELDRHEQALDDVRHAASEMGVRISPNEADHAAQMMGMDPNLHPQQAVEDALAAGEAAALQTNAERLAFGPPGLPPSAMNEPLPDIQVLREGIKPNPTLVRDLKTARAFTKREAEVLGHASFDNIVRRNSRGNETVVPGTAMSKFFDFANGVERPGAIANVGKFLDDIRSEWLKLSHEEQKTFDPATIRPVQIELREGARNYIMGKMLDAISSTERDMTGNRMLQYRRAMDWIDTNRDMLERTGLFTHDQMDLLDRFRDTAQMIQRGADLGRVAGSPTFTRAMHPIRFVDLFTGPLMGRALGAGAGALMGTFLTRWLGEAAIGAMIGAEMSGGGHGAALLQAIYNAPREKLLRALDQAFRDPTIAHDLAQKSATAGKARPSDATKNWIMSLVATQPAATGARTVGVPARQPEMAQ